jgi:thymidylate synthase (FAD)
MLRRCLLEVRRIRSAQPSEIINLTEPKSEFPRGSVAAFDALLGRRLPVLDDGFVRLVDYMGSDLSIVQAARISYGEGTKRVHEDRGLIRYLMRHRHTTPFEMCELKLHLRVPMDAWRQWIRHRTANVNEYSTRYSVAIDRMQQTQPAEWRSQSDSNRQGSGASIPEDKGRELSQRQLELQQLARSTYEERLSAGVAREQARMDLPLSTYTEAYWKIDLHNLLHFLELRMNARAQEEIRAYANIIGNEMVRLWCPLTWEAFLDYRLSSLTLSRQELSVLKALTISPEHATSAARAVGLLLPDGRRPKTSRELDELEEKLHLIGHRVPWTPSA